MKTDFRRLGLLLAALISLSACGKNRTAYDTFEKTADECTGAAVPNRFLVRYVDGSLKAVEAPSKEEFIEGYLTENLEKIEYAEHEYRLRTYDISPQAFARPSADNWGVVRVAADSLWRQGVRGEGVAVAVIDTGVDFSHPQLSGRMLVNEKEIPGNGKDDDGNGLIDDYIGFDFARTRSLRGDYGYHGTHVAGIVAAEHSDTVAGPSTRVQGMAPAAKILPLAFIDESKSGDVLNAVTAIKYAVSRGVRVINASWGGPGCSRSLSEVVSSLAAQNVLFVAASGNEGWNVDREQMFPASLNMPTQLTVGAVGLFDIMTHYSNYGSRNVHLFAPGDEIVSTLPGNEIGSVSGTSMASPMVAGAAALLLSAEPSASAAQVRQAILNTVIRDPDYLNATRGRLYLHNTLAELRRLMGR